MKFINALMSVLVVLSIAACTRDRKEVAGFQPVPDPKASTKGDTKNNTLFAMDLANLQKDLVWTIWMERADGSLYAGVRSGIPSESMYVYLDLSADKKFVHLFEKKTNTLDPRGATLIDRFPITSLDEKTVTFDFSQGLAKRFYSGFNDPSRVSEFNYSYSSVYDFENYDNSVTFSQLMQLTDTKASTVIMHHAFRLADMDNGFVPVKAVQPLKLGIFPADFAADEESKEPVAIRKWDTRKPIKFYISSNTPAEYIPAIKQGLQWWNDALGFEFIQVEVLTKPVNWGSARINILQWSDDLTFCGGASAIGPSEANPLTGQIYSGKIIFCGKSLLGTYDIGVEPGTISREAYYQKLMAWTTAHEMGHVLGFSHNFAGKLYRDKEHPEILNSTVMDYPFPNEIPAYTKVGPADTAKIAVSYFQSANPESVTKLKNFPYCSDGDVAYKPDCTHFIPGGLTPVELTNRYLQKLTSGASILNLENSIRFVILKQLTYVADDAAVKSAGDLFKLYPGNRDLFASDLYSAVESGRPHFMSLPADRRSVVLKTLSDCVLNCNVGLTSQKTIVGIIGRTQTIEALTTLKNLNTSLETQMYSNANNPKTADTYRLREVVLKFIQEFWQN